MSARHLRALKPASSTHLNKRTELQKCQKYIHSNSLMRQDESHEHGRKAVSIQFGDTNAKDGSVSRTTQLPRK